MNQDREHREVSSGRASKETARRFSGSLRREVGDLEVRLEEAQLRSDAFLQAGLHGEAARVLEESREMVDEFHQRLNRALAQAAVEREAEQIFASSGDVLAVLGEDETTGGGVFARIPAGIGAAVASVAVLAMALVTMRAPVDRDVSPATDISALDEAVLLPAEPATLPSAREQFILSLTPLDHEVLAEGSVDQEAVAPLLGKRRQLLDLLRTANPSPAVIAELQLVVDQLRDEGIDVEVLLRREAEAEAQADADQADSSQEPVQEPQPEPEPEPTQESEPEPSESESDDDSGVFPPFGGDDDEEAGASEEPSEEPSPKPSPSEDDPRDDSGDSDGDAKQDADPDAETADESEADDGILP